MSSEKDWRLDRPIAQGAVVDDDEQRNVDRSDASNVEKAEVMLVKQGRCR